MARKHESPALRLVVTLVHLALFAELGVATRVFLDKFLVLGCGGGWGPCIQSELCSCCRLPPVPALHACCASAWSCRPCTMPLMLHEKTWRDSSQVNQAVDRSVAGAPPCLLPAPGGAYFKDIASNMLGSFVIGLFAASSVLGLATDRALAILPMGHPWQSNLELQIGRGAGGCWPCMHGKRPAMQAPTWLPPGQQHGAAVGS